MFRAIQEAQPSWVLCENVAGFLRLGLDAALSDLEGEGYAVQTLIIPACGVDAPHKRERVWIVAYAGRSHGAGDNETGNFPQENGGGAATGFKQSGEQPGILGHAEYDGSPATQIKRGFEKTCESAKRQESAKRDTHTNAVDGSSSHVPDADNPGRNKQRGRKPAQEEYPTAQRGCRWPTESEFCGISDGLSPKLDKTVNDNFGGRVQRLKQLGNAVVPQVVEQIGRAIMGAHYE